MTVTRIYAEAGKATSPKSESSPSGSGFKSILEQAKKPSRESSESRSETERAPATRHASKKAATSRKRESTKADEEASSIESTEASVEETSAKQEKPAETVKAEGDDQTDAPTVKDAKQATDKPGEVQPLVDPAIAMALAVKEKAATDVGDQAESLGSPGDADDVVTESTVPAPADKGSASTEESASASSVPTALAAVATQGQPTAPASSEDEKPVTSEVSQIPKLGSQNTTAPAADQAKDDASGPPSENQKRDALSAIPPDAGVAGLLEEKGKPAVALKKAEPESSLFPTHEAPSVTSVGKSPTTALPVTPVLRETSFADANHGPIISTIRTELLPNGGTMHIRLDPPELGALQVTIKMQDGMVSASFQTSNDEATQLLSHTLSQLKQSLETAGISVDKIHVQQTSKDTDARPSSDDQRQQQQLGERSSQQEQQRKEMMRRLWRKLSGRDDLDMVA